jgi:dienelactone hydrolase
MRLSKRKRFLAIVLAAHLVGVLVFVCLGLVYPVRFDYDASRPLDAATTFKREFDTCRQYKVTFTSANDQTVHALLCLPKNAAPPFPCIILLHGLGQDKDLIDDIHPRFMKSGYAMICIDSQYRGERERPGKHFISPNMFETRQTFAQTVVDARRTVDYLLTRNDIEPDRIVLLGASMGGILGATAAAYEPRIKTAVLLYAGGDMGRLLAESTIIYPRTTWWRSAIASVAGRIIRETNPERHIAGISPRPVLMINGSRDSVVPVPCAELLFEAANEPKKIIWHDSDHIGLDDPGLVDICIDEAIAWFDEVLERQRTDTAARQTSLYRLQPAA